MKSLDTPTPEARLPTAKSARSADERPKIRAAIQRLGLAGLANDTKWNRLISEIRSWDGWRPSFRHCWLENDYISGWDVEWFYHLPIPFIGVRWFEISCTQELPASGGRYSPDALRLPKIVSHLTTVVSLVSDIGFTFRVYDQTVRIFGYSPVDERFIASTQAQ